jgi:hypothetical protein
MLLAWSFLVATARAQLEWPKPLQAFHRAPEDLQLHASFPFRNAGSKPVEIARIAPSCGCTAARLDQKRYGPGEAGRIEVDFTFDGRRGEQRKFISVTTDDGRQYALELRCVIEGALDVKPGLVFWRIGDPPDEKTVELTVSNMGNVSVTGVKSNHPSIAAVLVSVEKGRRYLVKIRPLSTTEKVSAQLTVQSDFPPDAPKNYVIFARVK